ncbi:hypothetical protein JRO89_XS06G0097800 [Xanthoceras sorbifolium]|uniref:Gnk2-homologous domain-containing protein n=1 Tax=Xanthoceras sorbifolium TaxID=99658 RepID=A0ABQ8HXM4_9ROSI|nr:hypothetical protein JRO89_XS06G0097800 [Xanthoceras sorbifolium]
MGKSHSRLVFFIFSSIFISFFAFSVAQQNFLFQNCANNIGNYTSNSAFGTNLNSALSSISSNTVIDYGFYNESLGQEPDRVNAIALCRGDVSVDVCRGCLQNVTRKIVEVCPNQKEAIGGYDECMLRYSNKTIFGILDTQISFSLSSTQNVSENVNQFNQALQDLLGRLRDTAASGDSHRKFATGDTQSGFQRIYALVQCTPDLDLLECSDCLDNVIGQLPGCCNGKMGGRVINPSCNFRYEVNDRFFSPTPDSAPPSPTGNDNTARTVVIIVVPIVSVVILVICIFIFLRMRKQKPKETIEKYAMHGQFSVKSDVFSFGVLILEIVSGQRNNCFRHGENVGDLLSYAWKNWREGTTMNLIDPTLSNGSRTEMMRCIHIGLLCVQENVVNRPTMASVVLMLNSFSLTLPVPSEPAFFMHSSILETSSSVSYNTRVTESDYTKSETVPLSSTSEDSNELHPR